MDGLLLMTGKYYAMNARSEEMSKIERKLMVFVGHVVVFMMPWAFMIETGARFKDHGFIASYFLLVGLWCILLMILGLIIHIIGLFYDFINMWVNDDFSGK